MRRAYPSTLTPTRHGTRHTAHGPRPTAHGPRHLAHAPAPTHPPTPTCLRVPIYRHWYGYAALPTHTPQLVRLDLSHNKLASLAGLPGCLSLEELWLPHNQLGLAALAELATAPGCESTLLFLI
jgi:hypothetical protein